MKRENLTLAELWPLVGDGQCFDFDEANGKSPFKFIMGVLHVWNYRGQKWGLASGLSPKFFYKLVDDPSEPKQAREIEKELIARAKQIFDILEIAVNNINFTDKFKALDKKVLVSGLVGMFAITREDLIREIEERTK